MAIPERGRIGGSTEGPEGAGPPVDRLVMSDDRFASRPLAVIRRIRRTGEDVIITHRGKPVARVVPIAPAPAEDVGDERVIWDLEAVEP